MIIPFTKSGPAAPDIPSETNMLMALAEMQKQGRFQKLSDRAPILDNMPSGADNIELYKALKGEGARRMQQDTTGRYTK